MSGVEVGGLVVGILPLFIEAVKSYSTISRGFRTFRHYSKEIKTFSVQLKVQNCIFLNEIRLLLRLIEEEDAVEEMLKSEGDHRWYSKQLNEKLRDRLQHGLELCQSIIKDTADIIEELKIEIRKYEHLLQNDSQNDSIKDVIRRLRGAAKITFNKAEHERSLTKLRERNGDLGALRSQHDAFRQQESALGEAYVQQRALPARFNTIQDASQKLHEALCRSWRCNDVRHRDHYAKLCVAAEARTEVQLNLAISCQESSAQHSCDVPEPPIWLYVHSVSISAKHTARQAMSITASQLLSTLPHESRSSLPTKTPKKKASSDLTGSCPRKKQKKVRFAQLESEPDAGSITIPSIIAAIHTEIDLCSKQDICHYLKQSSILTTAHVKQCLGYLETPQTYKHRFYLKEAETAATVPKNTVVGTVYSLSDVMREGIEEDLRIEDQLRLAHRIAEAMLQYSNTPWLGEQWRLKDLRYFGSKQCFDDRALETLHLSSQICTPRCTASAPAYMEGVQGSGQDVSDEVQYGINNFPLFSLGVALLEIAHWRPIEDQMRALDKNNSIFAARRIASSRPSSLGPEYHNIAKKCLQCNFGFGTQLQNKRLQTAVYNDVVCQLESMVEKLEI